MNQKRLRSSVGSSTPSDKACSGGSVLKIMAITIENVTRCTRQYRCADGMMTNGHVQGHSVSIHPSGGLGVFIYHWITSRMASHMLNCGRING